MGFSHGKSQGKTVGKARAKPWENLMENPMEKEHGDDFTKVKSSDLCFRRKARSFAQPVRKGNGAVNEAKIDDGLVGFNNSSKQIEGAIFFLGIL